MRFGVAFSLSDLLISLIEDALGVGADLPFQDGRKNR